MRILCIVIVLSCLWLGCSEDQCTCPGKPPFRCPSEGVKVIMVGLADDFSEPMEPVFPDSNHARFIAEICNAPLRYLDDMTVNKQMGHTFTWLPFKLSGAELEIHLRSLGDFSANDRLSLELNDKFFEGEGEVWRWTTTFTILTQTEWFEGEEATLILDLGYLPVDLYGRSSVLQYMEDGNLDVNVQDDTAVDYIILRLFCTTSNVAAKGD